MMTMVNLGDDRQGNISFILMNMTPASVCIFILVGYLLLG